MRAAIALALVVSVSASAECKKEDFNRYLAAAVRLYEALEYERALDSIAKAKESSCGVDDDAQLGLYEGTIRSDLGQGDQARIAFKEALLLKPDAEIPLKVSPKVKKQIEALRAEAKKELAPILAKQEEERRKKVAEENERQEKARREDEARRAEEQRRADDARRAADNAKTEDQRRAALEELRRLEEARRLDDARRAEDAARRGDKPSVIVIEKPSSDRPENREFTAAPSNNGDDVPSAVRIDTKQKRGVPVIPIVFGGAALIAGGVGAYFGVTGRQGQTAAANVTNNQVERLRLLTDANQSALIADILFGVAGAAALGAVISLFASPSEPVTEPAR